MILIYITYTQQGKFIIFSSFGKQALKADCRELKICKFMSQRTYNILVANLRQCHYNFSLTSTQFLSYPICFTRNHDKTQWEMA